MRTLLLLLAALVLGGCARPERHRAPDRAATEASIVRIERAIPVVRRTHEAMGQGIARTRAGHAATREAHAAQGAIIDALVPQVGRIKEIALRADPAAIDLRALQAEIETLESTAAQLVVSRDTTATLLRATDANVDRLLREQEAHGRAIGELVQAKDVALAESRLLIAGFEEKIDKLNALEIAHADALNALNKARIVSGLNKVWTVASGAGAAALALLFAVGKLGLK